MSHSTHVGFSCPPICSDNGREFRFSVDSDAFPDFQGLEVGVGHIRDAKASIRLPPSLDFRGVTRPPWLPSVARGVGHIAFVLLASGVGNKPDPIAAVRGADGASWYTVPRRIVPERGKASEYGSHPETKQAWDVFHEDVAWSNLANETGIL